MKQELFARSRSPRPPKDLRDRVLRAARAAAREAVAPPTRRRGFTRLDLVWATALLLLVAANALLSLQHRHTVTIMAENQANKPRSERTAEVDNDRDLAVVGMALEPTRDENPEPPLTLGQLLHGSS